MCYQRKEDRCCRIVPFGYEWGFLGMEGRGLFAGATVAGVHAEITGLQKGFDRARGSIGFQEKVFFGYGNNMGRAKFDDNDNIVRMELWMPTLGRFGHLTFGDQYDVSREGIAKAQREKIKELLGEEFLQRYESEKDLAKKATMLHNAMSEAGFENKKRLNLLHEGKKITYGKKGEIWGDYGNVETITDYSKNGKPIGMYSSYNYGNHYWTHLIIDVIGFYAGNN